MSWPKERTQVSLKLRVLKQNKEDWDKFFEGLNGIKVISILGTQSKGSRNLTVI